MSDIQSKITEIQENIFNNSTYDMHIAIMEQQNLQEMKVPLYCTLNSDQHHLIKLPVRNTQCKHSLCVFDIDSLVDYYVQYPQAISEESSFLICPQCNIKMNPKNLVYDISLEFIFDKTEKKCPKDFQLAQYLIIHKSGKVLLDLNKDLNAVKFKNENNTGISSFNELIFNLFRCLQAYRTKLLLELENLNENNRNQNQQIAKKMYCFNIDRYFLFEEFTFMFDEYVKLTKQMQTNRFTFARTEQIYPEEIHITGKQGLIRIFSPYLQGKNRFQTIQGKFQHESGQNIPLSFDQRNSSLAIDFNMNIWISGGVSIKTRAQSTNEIFIMDLKNVFNNQALCIKGPKLQMARQNHASIFLNQYVYIVGGVYSNNQNGESFVQECERIDVKNYQKTEVIGSLNVPRKDPTLVKHLNRQMIFCFGGVDKYMRQTNIIEILDIENGVNQWQQVQCNQYLGLSRSLGQSIDSDRIILIGGVNYEAVKDKSVLEQKKYAKKQTCQIYSIQQNRIIENLDLLENGGDSFCDSQAGFHTGNLVFLNNNDLNPKIYSFNKSALQVSEIKWDEPENKNNN